MKQVAVEEIVGEIFFDTENILGKIKKLVAYNLKIRYNQFNELFKTNLRLEFFKEMGISSRLLA